MPKYKWQRAVDSFIIQGGVVPSLSTHPIILNNPPQQTPLQTHTHLSPSVSMEISGVCILPWRRGADYRLFCWPSGPIFTDGILRKHNFQVAHAGPTAHEGHTGCSNTHAHRRTTNPVLSGLPEPPSADPLTALISLHQADIRRRPHSSCCPANYSHMQLISISH